MMEFYSSKYVHELEKKLEIARLALEFYAELISEDGNICEIEDTLVEINEDGFTQPFGDLARTAIKEIE